MFCADRDMTLHSETDPETLSSKHQICATFLAKFDKIALKMHTALWVSSLDWSYSFRKIVILLYQLWFKAMLRIPEPDPYA
jgi:hypothetical protein